MSLSRFRAAFVLSILGSSHASAQATGPSRSANEPCFLLALGPSVFGDASRVRVPAVIALRSHGTVAGALNSSDTLVAAGDIPAGEWNTPQADSITVNWHPMFLGGTLELHFRRSGQDLRGRYSLHAHQADDGRAIPRGSAAAFLLRCQNGRPAPGPELDAARGRLLTWRREQAPDTALARTEALAAFDAFLRTIPVHAITLMNYRIAEFSCLKGHVPASIEELRALRTADLRDTTMDWLGERVWQDAWRHPMIYRRHGLGYEVRSAGRDGIVGSADDLVATYETIPLKRYRRDHCQ
jgi:type II secretion system (T2SS) protein G